MLGILNSHSRKEIRPFMALLRFAVRIDARLVWFGSPQSSQRYRYNISRTTRTQTDENGDDLGVGRSTQTIFRDGTTSPIDAWGVQYASYSSVWTRKQTRTTMAQKLGTDHDPHPQ